MFWPRHDGRSCRPQSKVSADLVESAADSVPQNHCCVLHTYIVELHTHIVDHPMALPRLSRLELRIMEALWSRGALSIREIQEAFPERRPAYTTVQTTVYRLEAKGAVRRVKKIGNAHIFEGVVSRDEVQRRLIDDLLGLFGGRTQPVMAHLIETGKLTLEDVKEAEKALRDLERKDKRQ